MRLDKFLKVSRIIKRRTLAKQICSSGGVTVNGRAAKASTEVKAGDVLEIKKGTQSLKARIVKTPETVASSEADTLYQIMD